MSDELVEDGLLSLRMDGCNTVADAIADRIEELEAHLAKAVEALQRIGLGSQNRMTTKDALGREARVALAEIKGEQKCT